METKTTQKLVPESCLLLGQNLSCFMGGFRRMLECSCRKAIKCSILECVNLEDVAENNRALSCKMTERALWVSQRFYVGYGCDIGTKNMWFPVNWGWTFSWVSINQHHKIKLWFVRTDACWIKQQVKQWQSLNLKRNPWIHKIF